jgi:TRAP-type C4-dicarboxylate transport system permease small subunit
MNPTSERFRDFLWYVTSIGSFALLVAVIVTVVEVVGRATNLLILRGVIDMVGILMVIAMSTALAECQTSNLHIQVEPLSAWLPQRFRAPLDRFWHLVAAALFGVIVYRSAVETIGLHRSGEVMPGLGITLLVYGVIVVIGFGIATLAATSAAFRRADQGDGAP